MVVLALTIGAASAMADVLNTSLAGDECVCGSDDSSTSVSVPGDPPGDPPATGLILPNTGSAGLLGTGVGPHLSLLHFILALALILIAAGGLGLVVERPVLAAQTISGAHESTKG